MDKIQELRDKRDVLIKACEEIPKKAKAEDRDEITDDEKALCDKNLAEYRTLGEELDIELADEKRLNAIAAARSEIDDSLVTPPFTRPAVRTEPRILPNPAIPKSGRKLRAFSGPDAEERAHRFGIWSRGILFGDSEASRWGKDAGIDMRAMSESSNLAGGYTVPDEFDATLINLQEQWGMARQHCNVVPMARDTKTTPRRTAGLTAYSIGENTTPTESDITFDQVHLVAKKFGVLTRYPTELLEDSAISIGDLIAFEVAQAFAEKEDDCLFNGDGSSTYGGIFGLIPKINDGNHAGSIYTALTANTAFSTLDLVDLEGMIGTLPDYAEDNAKVFISKVGWFSAHQRLMDAAGGNTDLTLGDKIVKHFLGYQAVWTRKGNTTTSAQTAVIIFFHGDMRMAVTFGDRRDTRIMVSEHRYMDQDQIGLLATERFDIQCHDLGDGTDAGPLVAMKTPAS